MKDDHDQLARPSVIGADTRIVLHPLAMRAELGEWIVGRMVTGEFVALPGVGKRAVDLLAAGHTVAETADRLSAETGDEIDVPQFVRDLLALEFVAAVDGRPVPSPEPRRASLPRLRPEHLRFALSPWLPLLLLALFAAAAVSLAARPENLPSYHALLWSPHGSVVIALTAAAGWALLILHELGHLVAARATGVPGRIRFGTRLQFLVLQTDISGIELAPRRQRLTAYLAGIAVNLTAASVFCLALPATAPGSAAHRLLAALFLIALLPLPFQLGIFMRTDLYFVLQDLTGCHNLYADGRAYAAHRLRRLTHALTTHRGPAPEDPTAALPRRERLAVRLYSIVLVIGTALCLLMFAVITVPVQYTLVTRALGHLGPQHTALENLDAIVVIGVISGVYIAWAFIKWRTAHRSAVGS